jgi:ATP-binding protein involved in chromosome partitioning
MINADSLHSALNAIADPLGGGGILTTHRAAAPRVTDARVSVVLDVTGLSAAERDALEADVKAALSAVAGVEEVRVALTSTKTVRKIIAVASGKGGVGKSTLSANLAVALARAGIKVGLVDADIYGPSQPRLMGVEGVKPDAEGQKLHPVKTPFGIGLLSIGQLVKPGQAVAWRGPMAGNALSQLIDAHWADAEVLIVDLPPGTGDVQLSMIQKHKPAAAVIVSTPQDLALIDATRAVDLFSQAGVPIIGVVENMAGYACPSCGAISDPFGTGGAESAAQQMGLPFLGRIPLEMAIRIASDGGTPPASGTSTAFDEVAANVLSWLKDAR